ncbi:molybdate ABC transporter permease subunit [Paraburkholderia sp. J12]|uniref:molybdate ABC transporter permease subunit n=1 Tax=Paraburkholderia sp. J12 TaxID=2805432 RepID=UPI002ABD4DD2|nr:ABC transporter permease subunit [Paraburkholderia sp. J12]
MLPALVLLVLPLVALVGQTHWTQLEAAYGDWHAVEVSVTLSAVAMIAIVGLGLPLSFWLARTECRLKGAVETLVLLSLLTPSLATGILLVSVYGPYGSVGELLDRIGISLNNNASSFIVAQVYGGLAYFVMAARTAFENVPRLLEEAAQDLGCSPWGTFRHVSLCLAAREILVGAVVAWVRIIGEFGIVAVFSYFPQGIPVKLFVNLQNDGVQSVYVLVWILLLLTLPVPLLVLSLSRRASGR